MDDSSKLEGSLVARTLFASHTRRADDQTLDANWLFTTAACHASGFPFVLKAVVSAGFAVYSDRFGARNKASAARSAIPSNFRCLRTTTVATCHLEMDYTEPGTVFQCVVASLFPLGWEAPDFQGNPCAIY